MQQDNSYSLWNELHKWLYLTSQGDGSAFTHILQAFWHNVYAYTLDYANPSVSREVTQAVFLKIWADRESLNAIENFSVYLFSITRNEIIALLFKNGSSHSENKRATGTAASLFSEKAMWDEWERKAYEKKEDEAAGKLIEAFVMEKLREEVAILPEWQPVSVMRSIAMVLLVLVVLVTANYLYCNRKTQTGAPAPRPAFMGL